MRQSERLWHLACKYRMGASFHGLWVENTDLAEVAAQIGADPASGVACRWEDVGTGLEPSGYTSIAWMGSLNDGWTQVVGDPTPSDALPVLSAGQNDPDPLPGWREYSAWTETLYDLPNDDMVDDAYESMPPEWGHLLDLSLNGYSPQLATCITSALILVGRVTGREFDEAWMESCHTRYTIR